MSKQTSSNCITLYVTTASGHTFEDICQALAEGEHSLGQEATYAGNAMLQWPDRWYGVSSVDLSKELV